MSSSSPEAALTDKSDQVTPLPADGGVASASYILTGKRLATVFASMLLACVLLALDQTILAPALPTIASQWNAYSEQGWMSSSFVLVQTSFCLVFGQLLTIYSGKSVLLICLAIFEIGSIVCATSNSAAVMIVGRAISGVGAAGLFMAMVQIVTQCTKIEDRPKLLGIIGAIFMISAIAGPLIGGALTHDWRWIFWLNLPIGGLTMACVTFFLPSTPPLGYESSDRSLGVLLRATLRLDYVGAVLSFAALTSLSLALQWGGNTKPWKDGAVIACFVVAGVLAVSFVFYERYLGDRAMVPMKLFKSRSIYAIVLLAFFVRVLLMIITYYIPLYYQAVRGKSSTASGVALLPSMLASMFALIFSGQAVGRIGRPYPFMLFGSVCLAAAMGGLYSVRETTTNGTLVGLLFLFGIGTGSTSQLVILAIQGEWADHPHLLGQASALVSYWMFFGGTIGLAIGQPAFAGELAKNLAKYAPTAPATSLKDNPTLIYSSISDKLRPSVIKAFSESLRVTFLVGLPVGFCAIISAALINNINLKANTVSAEDGVEKGDAAKKKEEEAVEV